MALIVEDGTGLATAESYISVVDTDTYFAVRGNPTGWTGLATPDKEQHLRKATEYLDTRFLRVWKGVKIDSDMALDWPRRLVRDASGFLLVTDALPVKLERATAEAALRSATTGLDPDVATPGSIESKRSKVGELETETHYLGGAAQTSSFPQVDQLVAELIVGSNIVRVGN